MGSIKIIMVAVDLSDYSLQSVRYAAMLAESLDARLILVNIYNERDVNAVRNALGAYYDSGFFDKMQEENLNGRRQQVAQLAEQAGVSALVEKQIIRLGTPYLALLDIIDEEKPDLLVMATKGRGNMKDTIIGSCAAKMYRKSPVPVLSLRPQDSRP